VCDARNFVYATFETDRRHVAAATRAENHVDIVDYQCCTRFDTKLCDFVFVARCSDWGVAFFRFSFFVVRFCTASAMSLMGLTVQHAIWGLIILLIDGLTVWWAFGQTFRKENRLMLVEHAGSGETSPELSQR
jgi:hypothetical protein